MLGAIAGDIVGSVYEWHNIKTKEFPLYLLIILPIGSIHGFGLVHIRAGKVAEKLKTGIKKEGFRRSKTAESPCLLWVSR